VSMGGPGRLAAWRLNATKFVHEFRAATLECNAGQCEVELRSTLFHKSYISDVLNSFINRRLVTKYNDWSWVLLRTCFKVVQ